MKQYLLMVNEDQMKLLHEVSKVFQFLEVQALNVNGVDHYKLLCAPVSFPVDIANAADDQENQNKQVVEDVKDDSDPGDQLPKECANVVEESQ